MSLECAHVIITEFKLQGLEKVNLNKLYRLVSRYGRSCKLGFNFSASNKVVDREYLSLTEFLVDREEELKKELLHENIVCSP